MLLFPYIISQFSGSKWQAESKEALLLSFQVYPSSLYCFLFPFTNLPQHGADSCPVPALPTRRKLLVSAFCQQSFLYEHYRTHQTNSSGINAEQALTQNHAQQLGQDSTFTSAWKGALSSRSRINSLGQSSPQTAICWVNSSACSMLPSGSLFNWEPSTIPYLIFVTLPSFLVCSPALFTLQWDRTFCGSAVLCRHGMLYSLLTMAHHKVWSYPWKHGSVPWKVSRIPEGFPSWLVAVFSSNVQIILMRLSQSLQTPNSSYWSPRKNLFQVDWFSFKEAAGLTPEVLLNEVWHYQRRRNHQWGLSLALEKADTTYPRRQKSEDSGWYPSLLAHSFHIWLCTAVAS